MGPRATFRTAAGIESDDSYAVETLMSAPTAPPRVSVEQPPPTLASRPFPPRVRRLLEGILEYATEALERGLTATLNDVEQQLFKLAEQARSDGVQQACFESLRAVKRSRSDFTPRYMIGLEAALAGIQGIQGGQGSAALRASHGSPTGELGLVEDRELEESSVLYSIASRAEVRSSLALYLLGQRFGVLAGAPAFEPENLPVGPQSLCRILRRATDCMEIPAESRVLVFRQFERHVLAVYGEFVDAINRFLADEGVLATLSYVPMRVRRSEDEPRQAKPAVAKRAREGQGRPGAPSRPAVNTRWPGESMARDIARKEGDEQHEEMFSILRQLLGSRRELTGKLSGHTAQAPANLYVASPTEVESVLGVLQHKPTASVLVDGKPSLRPVQHVKQDLLAQLRQMAPQGKTPALSDEDGDTIDLVAMLFDFIMREIRPSSPAAGLLAKLQVPLMRVAMRDKGFFTQQVHPARQMLSAIAETGAYWSDEDDGDRATVEKMRSVVDRVVGDFDGDVGMFESLSEDLGSHLQTLARKAEVAERRHVEAARGKEKLALARLQASEAVTERVKGHKIPRFVHTLLTQAWTDVLALSLLRQGEDSDGYRRQLEIAERLVRAAGNARGAADSLGRDEALELRDEIEQSLGQVGYHAEDAKAIATRLTSIDDEEDTGPDDPASRTELALRLKARSRLGGDVKGTGDAKQPALNAHETACLEQIKALPFGSWLEFVINQQGDVARRRMSWYSTLTGQAVFVNARGHRVGNHTLDGLAQMMANGQLRLMESEKGNLIDRAWGAIVSALKGFQDKGKGKGKATQQGLGENES